MKLKVLDLFSGIGGFSLGLERTGGFRLIRSEELNRAYGIKTRSTSGERTMPEFQECKGFDVFTVKPSRRTLCIIKRNGRYLHTSYNMADAKRMIDFCTSRGVWK